MSSNDSESRRSIRFADTVDPGQTIEETWSVENAATVEGIDVRIYRGAELDLHVRPWVSRAGSRFDLIQFLGKDYVDGDGDHWEFPVSEAVDVEDEIGVTVTNEDDQYQLDYAVDVTLDRAGGVSRFGGLLDNLISSIRGAF